MGTSLVLVTLIVGLGVASMFYTIFQTLKFDGEPDYLNLVMGVVGAMLGYYGIQSGVGPDYATSLAITGVVVLVYAWGEARNDLRETKDAYLAESRSQASSGERQLDS